MPLRSRWEALGVQLLIAVLVSLALLALMLGVWYPEALFEAAGGDRLFFILSGVNLVLGPLITLVIFKPGKAGLESDLAVMACLQIAALLYGCGLMYTSRPAFIVFVKDRFELATAGELPVEQLAAAPYGEFRQLPRDGPVLAAADFPVDALERKQILDAALEGLDMQHFPRYWVPYAQRTHEILAGAETIKQLRASDPAAAGVVAKFLESSGIRESEVRYLALRAPRAWVAVLVDPKTARPVKMLLGEKI